MSENIIIPGSICARLIDAGIITTEQLEEALEIQKTSKQLIGTILTQLGYCTEEDVARMLASKTGHKFISIDEVGVNIAVANLITPELAVKNNII